MTDTQTIKNMIAGLRQKTRNLRADEAVFLKLSGINEEIEKAAQDRETYQDELKEAKKRRDDAKKRKAGAVGETTNQICDKMNVVLPSGKAIFSYDEDDQGKNSLRIGWEENGTVTPYNGLSGMQKQVFDAALANVLDADIIVVEAAELDAENLEKTLLELAKLDKQVIVNTWFDIKEAPEPFQIVGV